MRHVQHAGSMSGQLGPAAFQLSRVGQTQREKVGRRLNIVHARLPVEHQQVHGPDGDLAHTAPLLRIPEHAFDSGSLLELAPPGVAVHPLIVSLFQHHGQHAGKRLCRCLVVLGTGQDVGTGVVVHRVGMLVGDGVEQPAAGRLGFALHHGVLVVLPVSHPEPQFVVHQALVQRGLARLVPLQDLRGLSHLFRPDGQFFIHFVQFITPFCPLSQGAVVSVLSGFLEVNLSVIADAMPPLLSRRGLGITQSFFSSPEAPLARGAVERMRD